MTEHFCKSSEQERIAEIFRAEKYGLPQMAKPIPPML
jgi:hypothetical protein